MFLKVWITRFWIWLAVLALVAGVAVWAVFFKPPRVVATEVTKVVTQVVEKPVEKVVTVVVERTVVVQATPVPATLTSTLTQMATVSNSPTNSNVAGSSVSSTVNVTSTTTFVSGTVSSGLVHPVFFEGQSTGKEYRASYDVGVKPAQVGIAFGYAIQWQGRSLGFPTDKCGLVVLLPGWYEKFTLTDGRYEVYDLPNSNQEFWMRDLARQRAEEQTVHYGCSAKTDVQVWKSGVPAVVWSIVAPPIVTPTALKPTASPTVTLTATVKSGTTATPTAQARVRTVSGKIGKANFVKGDEVWGWKITLESGQKCEGGCYLPSAPGSGVVEDGVVNPWKGEVPNGTSPWMPS